MRAWNGPYATYEQAIVSGQAWGGRGPIFEVDTKDPLDPTEVAPTIGRDDGWRGFIFGADGVTAVLVPEPSTCALIALGAATAFLMIFRTDSRNR